MTENKPTATILEEGQVLVRVEPSDPVAEEWVLLADGLGCLRRSLISNGFNESMIDNIVSMCLDAYLKSRYRDGMSFPIYASTR